MIVSLRGQVVARGSDHIVLEANSLGYQIFVPDPTAFPPESVALLHTVLFLSSREETLTLYGFALPAERELFGHLLRVNGVGPRVALAILAGMSVDSLRAAVHGEHPERITRVPGVGRKTAQKIILELRDRLGDASPAEGEAFAIEADTEVLGALVALGYSVIEAQTALQALPRDAPQSIEERVRLALQTFARA